MLRRICPDRPRPDTNWKSPAEPLWAMPTFGSEDPLHALEDDGVWGATVALQMTPTWRSSASSCSVHGRRCSTCARACGRHVAAKTRTLHLAMDTCFGWACGTRHWTKRELGQLRVAQTWMTRRVARWFPEGGKQRPNFTRRTAVRARNSHTRVTS